MKQLILLLILTNISLCAMEMTVKQSSPSPKIRQAIVDKKKAISHNLNTKFLAFSQLKNYRQLPAEMRRLIFCTYADDYFVEQLEHAITLPEVYAIELAIAQVNSPTPITHTFSPTKSSPLQKSENPFHGISLNTNLLTKTCKHKRSKILKGIQKTLDCYYFKLEIVDNLNAQDANGANALLIELSGTNPLVREERTLSQMDVILYLIDKSVAKHKPINTNEYLTCNKKEYEIRFLYKLCKLLIENGIDINSQDRSHDSALMLAARINVPLAHLLLDHGADPTIKKNNQTASDLIKHRVLTGDIISREVYQLLKDAEKKQKIEKKLHINSSNKKTFFARLFFKEK